LGGGKSLAKGSPRRSRSGIHGRARTRGLDNKGIPMKFRIYQHALTVMLAAYTLVHTFGAKWG
jgi:hypothetical protein